MRLNNIVTSPCKERNWAYINFLQVGKHIWEQSYYKKVKCGKI